MGRGDVARQYHQETAHGGPRRRPGAVPGFVPMDPANRPAPFKRYPELTPRPLPDHLPPSETSAAAVLSGRAVRATAHVGAGLLARLLFYSAGVVRVTGRPGARTYFRAAPSAGNLHPLETYVVAGPVGGVAGGLGAGVYHFAPDAFGLERLRDGDHRQVIADAGAVPAMANGPVALVVTGIPWRTAWKYGERGWRHLYWDAGTMLAQLLAVADGHGVEAEVLLGFRDRPLCELLGIDGVSEFPLAVVRIGTPAGPASPAAGDMPAKPAPLRLEATPIAPSPIELPLMTEMQRASDLHDDGAVERWRAYRPAEPASAAAPPSPPHDASTEPIEDVVLRRGSTRRMRREMVRPELLSWAMPVGAQHVPLDVLDAGPPGSTLLTHLLSVHGVEGIEPGLYAWAAGELREHRRGSEDETRERAERLCLAQELGGDSAYTVFACCDLDSVLDAYGDRGYRAAQLEAGLVAGRLQLAAFTLGYGGTGLTFFDYQVSDAFATDAACMLVTSVGVPGYRARRGGEPGRPIELTGFGSLQNRFVHSIGRADR